MTDRDWIQNRLLEIAAAEQALATEKAALLQQLEVADNASSQPTVPVSRYTSSPTLNLRQFSGSHPTTQARNKTAGLPGECPAWYPHGRYLYREHEVSRVVQTRKLAADKPDEHTFVVSFWGEPDLHFTWTDCVADGFLNRQKIKQQNKTRAEVEILLNEWRFRREQQKHLSEVPAEQPADVNNWKDEQSPGGGQSIETYITCWLPVEAPAAAAEDGCWGMG